VTTGRTDGIENGHRFNRSLCVKEVAVGVLTQYPRLRHCTGACSVVASVQPVLKRFADQLKQAFWNKVLPMHRCFDSEPSVQPVLKSSWSPSKHALWNKGLSLHRCFDFLTIGSTGALLDFFLHPEKIDRQGVGPSAMHRMLRCLGTGSTGAADFLCFQLF